MGKHSRKKQQVAVEKEEQEEPVEEELDIEKEDTGETVAKPATQEDEEIDFEKDDYSEDVKPAEIKKTFLILGLVFAVIGFAGFAGLRSGIIQSMMGYTASPEIGPDEMNALIASMVPLAMGLVIIGFWGVKNDPIYYQIEKAKAGKIEEEAAEEPESEEIPAEAEPLDDIEEEISTEITQDTVPDEFMEPMIEPDVAEAKAHVPEELDESFEGESFESLEDELGDLVAEEETGVPEAKAPAIKPEVRPELMDELDVLDQELADAEEIKRLQRCEKMLVAAVVLPEDKLKLKELILTGISAKDFTEEIKKAIEKRKKKEEEKDVTADDRASLIEDELIAELGELANDLGDKDDSELEDEILKELDDLDNL